MVMKDKLVKYNHKVGYYHMKKFGIALSCITVAATLIAIPTYITFNSPTIDKDSHAEDDPDKKEDKKFQKLLTYYQENK